MAAWTTEIAADIGLRTPKALAKWAGRAATAQGRLALATCRLKALDTETEQVRARGLNAWNEAAFQLMREQLPGDVFVQPAQAEMSMAVELLDLAERALHLLETLPAAGGKR